MEAVHILRGVASERLPTAKLNAIVKAVAAIEKSLEQPTTGRRRSQETPTAVGADDMMPIFHYVVAHAALAIPDLYATIQFLRFSLVAFHPKGGAEDYWLTMFEGPLLLCCPIRVRAIVRVRAGVRVTPPFHHTTHT